MSSNSQRSQRVKDEARSRPDMVWKDQAITLKNNTSPSVLQGGSELAQLIAKADNIQAEMRKIVQ